MMTAAVKATPIMAAPAALLHVARVPTRVTNKEIQGVHLATKHCLQAREKGKCPLTPKKPTEEEKDKPAHLTMEEWAAFNIAEEHKYTTVFERYIC
jgi:hypothetical protein